MSYATIKLEFLGFCDSDGNLDAGSTHRLYSIYGESDDMSSDEPLFSFTTQRHTASHTPIRLIRNFPGPYQREGEVYVFRTECVESASDPDDATELYANARSGNKTAESQHLWILPGDPAVEITHLYIRFNREVLINEPVFDYSPATKGYVDRCIPPKKNLLDNPWFTVNQRGQTSYSGSNVYTVDRWSCSSSTVTVNVTGDGVDLSTTSAGATELVQLFERVIPVGTEVTASILYSQDSGASGAVLRFKTATTNAAFATPIPNGAATRKIISNTFTTDRELTGIVIRIPNGGAITVHAIKLEYGSVSTLALDSPPDYAAELLKCQRYQFVVPISETQSPIMMGSTYGTATLRCRVPTPTEMRTKPAIRFLYGGVSNLQVRGAGALITPTAIALQDGSDNGTGVSFTLSGSFSTNQTYAVYGKKTEVSILLDANL